MGNVKKGEIPWRERVWEKARNAEPRTIELFGYDFQIDKIDNRIILSDEIYDTIRRYDNQIESRDFLENTYDLFNYDLKDLLRTYTKKDRQNHTNRFLETLDYLRSIELLNKFFVDIRKPELIPNEITTIIDQIPDDLSEIKQTLIKSLPSSEKQRETDQTDLEKVKPKPSLTKTQIEKGKRYTELLKWVKNAPEKIRNNARQLATTYLMNKGKDKEEIKVKLQNIRKEIGDILKNK